MKKKNFGEILDGGLCLCAVCGETGRMGGFLGPMTDAPQVVCYDCMIAQSAEEQGISIAAARKRRENAMRVSRLFMDIKMKEYLAASHKKDFHDIDEANRVLEYITNVWNTFDKIQMDHMARKKDDALAANYLSVTMSWDYLMEKPAQRRNEACACGSGRKFKVCCLLKDEQEKAELEKWKRLDTWVIRKGIVLMEEGKELDTIALSEFYFGKKRVANFKKHGITPHDIEEFNEWLLNDYYASGEETPYVLGRMLKGDSLSVDERKLVEARIEAPKSVYMVTFVKKGTGVLLRDVFNKIEVFVHDVSMSQSTQSGHAIFMRVYPAGKYYLASGGFMSYPPMYIDERLKQIEKAHKKSGAKEAIHLFLRRNGHLFGRLI